MNTQHLDGQSYHNDNNPNHHHHAIAAAARPVSSGYSQPSPKMRQTPRLEIPRASSVYPDDVSPPDSPRTGDGARSTSPNISPITDAGSGHRVQGANNKSYVSNIPLPSQRGAGTTASYVSGWREKIAAARSSTKDSKTKWDDYSGEPTASEKGKSGQVIPGTTKIGNENSRVTTTISSKPLPKQPIFASTLKKVGRKESPEPSQPFRPRKEWKGPSGRSPIVPPVSDKPRPPNKALPTPSQRRQNQGFRQASGLKTSVEGRASPATERNGKDSPGNGVVGRRSLPQGAEGRIASQSQDRGRSPETESRGPLSKSLPPITDTGAAVPLHQTAGQNEQITPHTTGQETRPNNPNLNNGSKKTALSAITDHHSLVASPVSVQNSPAEGIRQSLQALELRNIPTSRFSATTYDTAIPESAPATPRRSFEEPPPPPPQQTSILERRRPVPTAGVNFGPKPPTRKPTPSDLNARDHSNNQHANDRSNGGTTASGGGGRNGDGRAREAKSLPDKPATEEAVDRITLLEAKLAGLNRRRANLQTLIHELTHVVQPSSIAYDMASRQEVRKTVEAMSTESDAIAKEIHETGLKLHRALKKRDEVAMFEPTGLWVRRVTE